MKTSSLILAASVTLLVSFQAYAQDQDYNDGMKQELNQQEADQIHPSRSRKSVDESVDTAKAPVVTQVQQPAQVSQPIYILQQPTSVPQAQAQPVTTIEEPAVKESRSEVLRKQREDLERQTEDKLANRLEEDRLKTEKERADKLFAPLAAKPVATPEAVAPVVVVPPPQPALSPAPNQVTATQQAPTTTPVQQSIVVVNPEPEVAKIKGSKEDLQPAKPEEQGPKFTVGPMVGIGSYPSLDNVYGSYAVGATGEVEFEDRFGIEVGLTYSSYDLKNNYAAYYYNPYAPNYVTDVTVGQLNILTGLNYHFLEGKVSPVAGILAGFTRRTYSNQVTYGTPSTFQGSSSFDAGLKIGLDVKVSKTISVGADLRYLWNVSYRTDNPNAYSVYDGSYENYLPTSTIEGSSYYFTTVDLKISL